jgi:hypothetical protein
MAPVPYWLFRRLAAGDRPATEEERRQWIGTLRAARPIRYDLIRLLTEYVIP